MYNFDRKSRQLLKKFLKKFFPLLKSEKVATIFFKNY